MKIYQNGDICPCCGRPLEEMSEEGLLLFSQLVHVAGLGEFEVKPPEVQPIDTGAFPPPDAGIFPPVKPIATM